jgi:acetamidase/formamidase
LVILIDLERTEKGLDREQAYLLCSATVDFNITQLVDGKVGVHGMLTKEIFVHKRNRGGQEHEKNI